MTGDPTVITLQITLIEDIPVEAPRLVSLDWVVSSGADGQPLQSDFESVNALAPAVITTSTLPLTCETLGSPCDDGDACTVNDTCLVGFCFGQPVDCDDDSPCTVEGCSPVSGCTYGPATGPCSDDDPCTDGDTCGGGICNPGPPLLCEDGAPCTLDKCVPGSGCDFSLSVNCDDGNVCTTEVCDPVQGCLVVSDISSNCSDPNPCTLNVCDPVEGVFFRMSMMGAPAMMAMPVH